MKGTKNQYERAPSDQNWNRLEQQNSVARGYVLRAQLLSHVRLFATPWAVTYEALNPGTEPASLTSPALAGRFFTTSATWETQY